MIAQFRTATDDQLFYVDLDGGRWYNPAEPLTLDEHDNIIVPEGVPHGALVPQGGMGLGRAYALSGRAAKNPDGSQNIVMFAIALVPIGRTAGLVTSANVPIKDRTALRPIESVRYLGIEEVLNGITGSEKPQQPQELPDGGTSEATPSGEEPSTPEAGIRPANENVVAVEGEEN